MSVDRAAIERSWKERGFSCGIWVDPPGQVWPDYVHDTDELVMVLKGDVEFEIDGKAHPRLTTAVFEVFGIRYFPKAVDTKTPFVPEATAGRQ